MHDNVACFSLCSILQVTFYLYSIGHSTRMSINLFYNLCSFCFQLFNPIQILIEHNCTVMALNLEHLNCILYVQQQCNNVKHSN